MQLDGYHLRCILEIWNSDEKVYREEKLITNAAQAIDFSFTLADGGNYKALLWADYVTDGTVTMVRPFGRLNIIEKDLDLLADLESISLSYNVPARLDVSDGTVTDWAVITVSLTDITSFPDAETDKANLFFDYILAPATGQTLLSNTKMTNLTIDYTLSGNVSNSFIIPSNIPVERNKRTNISGHILSADPTNPESANLRIEINDTWKDTERDEEIVAMPGDYYYQDGTVSSDYSPSAENRCEGIVFYADIDGRYYLVFGLTEGEPVVWGPETEVGATDEKDGEAIMAIIRTQPDWENNYPAFKWCADQGEGWYLPSKNEWSVIHHILVDNPTVPIGEKEFSFKYKNAGGVDFADEIWTSTESSSSTRASFYNTGMERLMDSNKSNEKAVHAIKKVTY